MLERRWGSVLGAGFVAALTACTSSLVQQRMAREIGCPESSVTVTELGAGGYRAAGCGQSVVYACAGPTGNTTCVRQDAPGAAATLQAADDQARAQQRATEQQWQQSVTNQSPQPPPPPSPAVAPHH